MIHPIFTGWTALMSAIALVLAVLSLSDAIRAGRRHTGSAIRDDR